MSWMDVLKGGSAYAIEMRGQRAAKAESRANRRAQREALQKGIQWKVKDAEMAGIHPLFALGAQTNMPAPMQTDFGGYSRAAGHVREMGMAMMDQASRRRAEAQAEGLMAAQTREADSRTALNLQEVSDKARVAQDQRNDNPARSVLNPPPEGARWNTSKTTTAQRVQDEYGDVVEAIYGAGRLVYDGFGNAIRVLPSGSTVRSRMQATPRPPRALQRRK